MKNDNQHISQSRQQQNDKAVQSDILAISEIVEKTMAQRNSKPRRRRRVDYVKKIMNDRFIMNA